MTEEEKNKLLFEYSLKKCSECKAINILKAQIEKMKDYGNCKYGYYGNMCTRDDTKCCKGCKYWELAE